MNNLLSNLITPQLGFEGFRQDEQFMQLFSNLYRIELFKEGLDLILTKLQQKNLFFEVKYIKGWDTNIGCFLTENNGFLDRNLNKFFPKKNLKIILRSLNYNVLAHEMAHALEYESGVKLGEEFRQAIGLDMKDRQANQLALRSQIQRLMVDALKAYKPHQFLSELFARYFELLSISRNVISNGDFTTLEVMDFFVNTTKFIKEIFNPEIQKITDQKISQNTFEIVKNVKLISPDLNFSSRVESRIQKNSGSFAKGIKSNASWQAGYQKIQEIDEKKS
jgi:hypothetical protein